MLYQRILTALILIPLTLLILYYLSHIAFYFLTVFITLAAAWEWAQLMGLKTRKAKFIYLWIVTVSFLIPPLFSRFSFFSAIALWWLLAWFLLFMYPKGRKWYRYKFITGVMGILILIPCWYAINVIRQQNEGFYALLFLFILIRACCT